MAAPTPDFAALFAENAPDAKRKLTDAQGTISAYKTLAHQRKSNRQGTLLLKATKAVKAGNHAQAADLAAKAFTIAPDDPVFNHAIGMILFEIGNLASAITFFERALAGNPDNSEIYLHIGMTAWKLDMLDTAEKFYRMALAKNTDDLESAINLTGVLRDSGRFDDAIDLLRSLVMAHPEDVRLWNGIATVLIEAVRSDEAQTFLNEALRLDPTFGRAWHNLGFALAQQNKSREAVEAYTQSVKYAADEKDRNTSLHDRSAPQFCLGRLPQAWADYAARRQPDSDKYVQHKIPCPIWDLQSPLTGKCVLVVCEQGIGDEVLFLSAAHDINDQIGVQGQLIIACADRLEPLVQRSFPNAIVLRHHSVKHQGAVYRNVPELPTVDRQPDVWLTIGMACEVMRTDIESFRRDTPAMKADEERVASIKTFLDSLGPNPKVGLCWKSKLMTATRSKYFSAFDAWEPVLRVPGVTFVSLQYGDVEEELAIAKNRFGTTIHQIPDLDLFKDLDGVAAAGAALDLCIGPMNASTNLAASVGCTFWVVGPRNQWTLMGLDRLAWYQDTRAFCTESTRNWKPTMTAVAEALRTNAENHRVAA